MPKQHRYSFALAALIALTIGFAFQADAAFLIFNDRGSFDGALGSGSGLTFNFNTFTSDQSFAASALNFGPFTLASIGVPPSGTNQVFGDSAQDEGIDGTPYASMFLDSTRSVVLDFHRPTIAFGADFAGSSAFNFGVFLTGSRGGVILAGPTGNQPFFGFISTEPFDRFNFLFADPDRSSATVRFDNISAASAVPEPSSLMLLGTGATLFAAYGGWTLRRSRKEGGTDQA